jgi:hypothetical protein
MASVGATPAGIKLHVNALDVAADRLEPIVTGKYPC